MKPILIGLASLTSLVMILFLTRRVRHLGWRRGLKVWQKGTEAETTRIDFYQRLLKVLEKQGVKRELYQTPLEFAATAGVSEAQAITNAYNRVRFGEQKLSDSERTQIDSLLSRLERKQRNN